MERDKEYIEDLPIADKMKYNYRLTKEDVFSDDGLFLIQCMVRDGMSMEAIAKTIGITPQTFFLWRKKSPELREACAKGKQIVDYQVENALLRAALGYKTETVKTLLGPPDKNNNRSVRVEKTITETGPNVTACLAWLNNRKPESWRKNRDSVLEYDDKEHGITINIVKGEPTQTEAKDKDEEEDW